jgi:hypothetical protein
VQYGQPQRVAECGHNIWLNNEMFYLLAILGINGLLKQCSIIYRSGGKKLSFYAYAENAIEMNREHCCIPELDFISLRVGVRREYGRGARRKMK